jgi:Lon-like protease
VTRQTWTALASAIVFVGLAILLVVVPVPFVAWSPGGARNTLGQVGSEPIIKVQGIQTYPTTGELDMTIVSSTAADGRLSLPQAVFAYWLPHRDTLPRDSVYAPGKSAAQVEAEDADQMETAQDDAIVAALRAADQPVTEMPRVYAVTVGGPAHRVLEPGDLIISIDGVPTPDVESVTQQIREHRVGDRVDFRVWRNGVLTEVTVATAQSSTQPGVPIVGITVDLGYKYTPRISFDLGQRIGGPSAGLVFALAIYDKITAGPLLAGRHVAGTGTITPNGDVGAIGGIQEKIGSAEKEGANAFLVPAANCADLAGLSSRMKLIKVATLGDAVSAVQLLDTPDGTAREPTCP